MQVDQQRLPMQNYVPEGMVLVMVPVVPLGPPNSSVQRYQVYKYVLSTRICFATAIHMQFEPKEVTKMP